MRLHTVDTGHRLPQKVKLRLLRLLTGDPAQPYDVIKVMLYRPEFFGQPFLALVQEVMRGPSSWSVGERELFAAFVARQNACRFCTGNHSAVASEALGDALIQAVLDDWHTAPVSEQVKAMLGYLEKLTLHPEEVDKSDVASLYAAGISQQAVNEAMYICVLFNIVGRIADALNFTLPASFKGRSAKLFLRMGYAL